MALLVSLEYNKGKLGLYCIACIACVCLPCKPDMNENYRVIETLCQHKFINAHMIHKQKCIWPASYWDQVDKKFDLSHHIS